MNPVKENEAEAGISGSGDRHREVARERHRIVFMPARGDGHANGYVAHAIMEAEQVDPRGSTANCGGADLADDARGVRPHGSVREPRQLVERELTEGSNDATHTI